LTSVFDPLEPETVRLTSKEPREAKTCDGFSRFEVEPSPKFHDHDVTGPLDVSKNWTVIGTAPRVRFSSNPEMGGPPGQGWRVSSSTGGSVPSRVA
jgi:hypothetical protein